MASELEASVWGDEIDALEAELVRPSHLLLLSFLQLVSSHVCIIKF